MEEKKSGIKKFFEEFKAFAMRGNVLDMAIGVVIGAAFGKITENAQAAVDISRVNRNMFNDMPKKPQVIKTIRVDTQGVDYPEPEKM